MRYAINPYLKHVGWLCPECGYQNDPDDAVCLSEICIDLREDEERERALPEVSRASHYS